VVPSAAVPLVANQVARPIAARIIASARMVANVAPLSQPGKGADVVLTVSAVTIARLNADWPVAPVVEPAAAPPTANLDARPIAARTTASARMDANVDALFHPRRDAHADQTVSVVIAVRPTHAD